jgi:hypothetical protein
MLCADRLSALEFCINAGDSKITIDVPKDGSWSSAWKVIDTLNKDFWSLGFVVLL